MGRRFEVVPKSLMIRRSGTTRSPNNAPAARSPAKTGGENMSTEKSWDTSYEWKAVLVMSLAFGVIGLPPAAASRLREGNAFSRKEE